VRSPEKLTNLLKAPPHNIPDSVIAANLTIVSGNATEINDVQNLFSTQTPISLIVSAVGGSPKLQASFTAPVLNDQPTLCGDAATVLVTALKHLAPEPKPFIVAISTTGIPQGAYENMDEDVPWGMRTLYHFVLQQPHADKAVMERVIAQAGRETPSVFSGWAIVRPTLLGNGEAKGIESIRVGWVGKDKSGPGPQTGYQISRADVGNFIFEKLVKGDKADWNERVISLTA
jgi:NAD(P)H-binding